MIPKEQSIQWVKGRTGLEQEIQQVQWELKFFSPPNELFLLGLSADELAVYSFLKRCENRKTHPCWSGIHTIGEAVV